MTKHSTLPSRFCDLFLLIKKITIVILEFNKLTFARMQLNPVFIFIQWREKKIIRLCHEWKKNAENQRQLKSHQQNKIRSHAAHSPNVNTRKILLGIVRLMLIVSRTPCSIKSIHKLWIRTHSRQFLRFPSDRCQRLCCVGCRAAFLSANDA